MGQKEKEQIKLKLTLPAGETLLDLLRSFVLPAGDIAIGSFELILRLDESPARGVSGTAGVLDLVSLEALEKTPCIGLHWNIRWI